MEIEVEEYVRTKSGEIGIFKKYAEEGVQQWFTMLQNGTLYTTATRAIVNHSKNIIDLIEVGDYVNGNEVLDKYLFGGEIPVLETTGDETNVKCMCEQDIKTILTKEQYMQNCYKIPEKSSGNN